MVPGEIDSPPDGVMRLAGHRATDLVARFGSPLIVVLERTVRERCRAYRDTLQAADPRSRIYYAAKAFLTTGFCRLIAEEGIGLDVVSWGELETALAAGFPPDRILMHGNAKTDLDLTLALRAGVGRIVIDNLEEIEALGRLTTRLGLEAQVAVRVTPGVQPKTHAAIQTGQLDSKFGFNLSGGAAEDAIRRVLATRGLRLVGLHCHIGSQIFEFEPYALAARAMMALYARAKREWGAPLDELNLGGGLAIAYGPDQVEPSIREHLEKLVQAVSEAAREHGVERPILCDEPGRSIVGPAGVTLYTVQSTKRIEGIRNYVSVDGGMADNPRYALYGARHPVLAATRMDQPAETLWSVSGRCCESGDMLVHDVRLPDICRGDLLAVLAAGAYTHSMASNYNRLARPAVILAAPGRAALLARRENTSDLLRQDEIPSWLEA